MPQMLHYLLKDHQLERAKEQVKNRIKNTDEEAKEAIKAATSIIEQAPPDQVPPDFAASKEQAVNALRQKIMDGDGETREPGWGVVSVYTCTGSCGGMEIAGGDDAGLGAYREEYAWKQPSLD